MRRLIVMGTAIALLLLMAVPATAERPETQEPFSITFTDVNPCTDLEHDVTLTFVDSVHEHNGRMVVHSKRSGSTSDGFNMVAGVENFVVNGHVARGAFVDQWRHDDGRKFMVHGVFVFNIDTLEERVDNFGVRCIGRR